MGHDRPASPVRGSQGADRPPRSAGLGAHRWSPSSGGGGRPAWAPRLPTWPCLSCHPGLAGHPTPQWGLGSGSRDTARPTHLCNTHARAPACTHLFSQSHWHAHTLTLILAGAHTAEALGSSLPPHCWARCAVGGGGHRLQKLPVPSPRTERVGPSGPPQAALPPFHVLFAHGLRSPRGCGSPGVSSLEAAIWGRGPGRP